MKADLETPVPDAPSGGERVLLVDDDPSVRETVGEMIRIGGYSCTEADGVARALELLRRHPFDLVVTDMNMPGAHDGLDLVEQVRELDDSIPVILITGFPSVSAAVNAMKRGAIDFISKPFDIRSISQLVAKALRERRLRQEIRRLQADVHKGEVIEKLNRQLAARVEELERLYTISEAMTQFMDVESVFEHVVRVAARVTGAQRVSLMMLDRGGRNLRIRASIGVPPEVVSKTRVRMGEGISGKVAAGGEVVRTTREVHHAYESNRDTLGLGSYASHSWLSIPISIAGSVYGVLNLTDKPDRADFSQQEEQVVRILAEKAGAKLENQALYEGIYSNLVDTLTSLVTTLEAKDPYTRQHSQRVTEYAIRIGEIVGIDEGELEMIEFAGMLHDIGKIGVRDEILTKAGGLTDHEYEAIKQHVVIGERIAEPLGLTAEERAVIRNHHERYDGRGYPDGMGGEEIPLLARIVTIADAFDAMASTRPYRRARSREQALDEIVRNAGVQFDPKLMGAAVEALRPYTEEAPPAPPDPTLGF